MTVDVQRHTFTVDDFHRMVEAGILGEHDRVELVEGEIVNMTPAGDRHVAAVDRLMEIIGEQLARRGILRVQSPVRLSDDSEPEPDLAILRRRGDFYRRGGSGPEDVMLLIEVADSSLLYDRTRKAQLYARVGVAEFWLVDLEGQTITAYREPRTQGYNSLTVARRGDSLGFLAIPDIRVAVDDIFAEDVA